MLDCTNKEQEAAQAAQSRVQRYKTQTQQTQSKKWSQLLLMRNQDVIDELEKVYWDGKRGIFVSGSDVRSIWVRHNLVNFKARLKALESKVALDRLILTEDQVVALERKT